MRSYIGSGVVLGLLTGTAGIAYSNEVVHRSPQQHVERADDLSNSSIGIAIDGKTISEGLVVNDERITDIAMSRADVSMRFDAKSVDRKLGITVAKQVNGEIYINPYNNYPSFIDKQELRLFRVQDSTLAKPIAIIPLEGAGSVDQGLFKDLDTNEIDVVLRAYDADGNFDETERIRVDSDIAETSEGVNAGYGISRLSLSRIPIHGGTVIVEGGGVKPNSQVQVMGVGVPVDYQGNFVSELLVPNGKHNITLAYEANNGGVQSYTRPVEIVEDDIFFFGLGELTYGQNDFTGPAHIQAANPEEFEEEYLHGRAAFYLRGKIQGKYLITAMADSNEGDIEEIFKNFDEKDPRNLFRRIDADRYYPVYGDDSRIEETAPTQGKFYVKVAHDKSYAMWGNFETNIRHTDFSHINRSLYGAKLKYESNGITEYGEADTELVGFIADPGTFATRDEFRGTGGSVYFLNFQDITVGSEKIRIETRDRHSGIVVSSKDLVYGKDYDIDYLQGRILLNAPLNSTRSDGDVISTGGSEYGDPVMLVVDYETTPLNTRINDNYIAGGSFQQWLGSNVLIGATASHENIKGGADNQLFGGNATLRMTPTTYVKGSYTQSKANGTAVGTNTSIDGGFSLTGSTPPAGIDDAGAIAVEAALDFRDLGSETPGRITAYYRDREAGFAGQGYVTAVDTTQYGGGIRFGGGEGLNFGLEADIAEAGTTKTERYLAELGFNSDNIFAKIGASHVKNSSGDEINDIGVRLGTNIGDNSQIYGFAQHTIDTKGNARDNHRYGIGGNLRITDKVTIGGETAIDEDKDISARVNLDYRHDEHSNYYLAYDLTSDRNNTGSGFNGLEGNSIVNNGALVIGGRQRFNSNLSVYAEESYYHGGGNDGLTHTFGVDFTPWEDFTVGGNVELGEVGNLDRTAVSLDMGYGTQDDHISVAGEYREEEDLNSNFERETYVVRANGRSEIDEEFVMLGRGNASFSDNNANFNDGEFIEGSLGLAYRPKDNDTLNLLAKYTYLYDLATQPQINSGSAPSYKQKAHLASIDATLDLNHYVTIGAKYGFKKGEVDFGGGWIDTTTHLGVLRGDVHVVYNWDAMVEGRILHQEETETTRTGALAGIYYHLNDNLKVGGGYSWSEFSDDQTNLDNDNQGWFVNAITKF